MLDPRFHFLKKHKIEARIIDMILQYYFSYSKEKNISKLVDYFNNQYSLKIKYKDYHYLINRYQSFLKWKRMKEPSKVWQIGGEYNFG